MSRSRTDAMMITLGLIAWIGVFALSWQGRMGVSGRVSDSILALLAFAVVHRLWRMRRRATQ